MQKRIYTAEPTNLGSRICCCYCFDNAKKKDLDTISTMKSRLYCKTEKYTGIDAECKINIVMNDDFCLGNSP